MAFNLEDWVHGLKLSLAGLPLPFAVDFARFNGKLLPRLPYCDPQYPYIVIMSSFKQTEAIASNFPFVLNSYGSILSENPSGGNISYIAWVLDESGQSWILNRSSDVASSVSYAEEHHLWTNHDIGKYPASKPIPVYGGAEDV